MSNVPSNFRTPKGSNLPLMNLRGKAYLQVMHRLIWFREDHPTGIIKTEMVSSGGEGKDRFYVFRAEVYIEGSKGTQLVATGYKRETVGDFADAMEKAEQGSVGRALNFLGYGTAFAANELDEGMRLADSPAPIVETETTAITSNTISQEKVTQVMTTDALAPRRGSFRKNVTKVDTAVGDDL